MFTVDFITFDSLLKREKKALYYIETKSGYELFTTDGNWQFRTFIGKGANGEFDKEFKSRYMENAIKVDEVSKIRLTLE